MGRFPRFILLCILFVSSNLAACSSGESQSTLPPLTFEPIATPVIAGDCNINSDLETWLQAAEFRVEAFTTFIQNSEGKSQNALRSEVAQVAAVLSSVANTPVVDCAVAINEQLRQAMTTIVEMYQAYVNHERDDLSAIRELAMREIEAVQGTLAELKRELDTRLSELSGG